MIPAAERIQALRERNPGAVELATAISLAVRADPELLRHARLAVGADATAEADLWWSNLVASQNSDGIMLEPAAAEALRERLAERPELLDASWSLISAQHAGQHTAVRLEELVNWLSVTGGAEAADRIEELLIAAAREWMTTAAEPAGGVRWIAGALRRLPRAAAASPAGAALGAAAATHLGRTPELDRLPADAFDNWFPWLLSRLETASLRVALIDGGIEFEGETGESFDAPDTDPVLLTLAWGTTKREITVRRGERTTVAVDADEVELTTIAGRRFTVRRRGAPSAGLDFSAVRAAHRPAVGLEAVIGEIRERIGRGGWGALSGPEGSGTTTALCAALDALEAEGAIVLQHFYGKGPAWWDDHATVLSSLVAQLRAARPELPDGPLDELLRAAQARSIVVALDNPPPRGYEELKRWLFESSFPSLTPGPSTFIVAGAYAAAVRDWLEDGDPYWRIDIDRLDLSRALVEARWPDLTRAFGGSVTLADSTTDSLLREAIEALGYAVGNGVGVAVVTNSAPPPIEFVRRQRSLGNPFVVVGDNVPFDLARSMLGELSPEEFIAGPDLLRERLMGLTWPGVEPLVTQPIARLRRLLDWIVTQPPRSLTITALPASLTGEIPWGDLEPIEHRVLGLIAAGFPGLTLGDVLWTLPPADWPSVMDALGRLQGLYLIDGTPFPIASDPAKQIELAGHRSLAPRDPNLADVLDPVALAAAHEALVPIGGIGVPPEYFARHEVAHALACGQPTAINAVRHVAAMTQRVHRLGLDAVAADAPPALADAIRALSSRRTDAADFAVQLYHELCGQLGPCAAAEYLPPNEALRPRLTAWEDTFAVHEERFTEAAALLPFGVALTSGEIHPFDGATFLAPGVQFVALPEQMVAAIGPEGITVAAAEGQFSLEGDVEWAAAVGDGLVGTEADGSLLHWPDMIPKPRRLLGHSGAVTAAATDERGPSVEVFRGGERLGRGRFIDDGLVLLDEVRPGLDPDAIEYGGRRYAAIPAGSTGLRVDVTGHPIFPMPGSDLTTPLAGPWFATASEDGTVAVWTERADTPVTRYRGHGAPVRAVAIRGRRVVSGGDDGTVRLWSAEDGTDVAVLGVGAPLTALAIRFDLKVAWGAADGSLGLWEPDHPAESERIAGHSGRVLGIDPDGVDVVSWAADGSVRLWTDDSIVFRGPGPAQRALAREDGVVVLWGDATVTVEHPAELDGLSALAINELGDAVAYGAPTGLAVVTQGRGTEHFAQARVPVACAFAGAEPVASFDRPIAELVPGFVAGRPDGAVELTPGADWAADAPGTPVLALDAEERGRVLSGHEDGTIRLWLPSNGLLQRSLLLEQVSPATHVAFCGELAASVDGHAVRLWDLDDGQSSILAAWPHTEITGLASPSDGVLVCATRDGTLSLWDLELLEPIEYFDAPAPLVALAARHHTVAARDSTGRLYIWDVSHGTEVLHDYSSGDRLRFEHDVQVLAIDAERVAIDQPPGFWDDLDDEGRFLVPPLIPAGRTVEIRADRPDIDLTIRMARDDSPDDGEGRRPESAPRPRRK